MVSPICVGGIARNWFCPRRDLVTLGAPRKKFSCFCCSRFLRMVAVVRRARAPAALSRSVHDGAADPVVIWNPQVKRWWMFYTNRRANVTNEPGVARVHGTARDCGIHEWWRELELCSARRRLICLKHTALKCHPLRGDFHRAGWRTSHVPHGRARYFRRTGIIPEALSI